LPYKDLLLGSRIFLGRVSSHLGAVSGHLGAISGHLGAISRHFGGISLSFSAGAVVTSGESGDSGYKKEFFHLRLFLLTLIEWFRGINTRTQEK
jgi:hypothetical protein